MVDPRIPMKSPGLAAFLAYLIPGLGHFYQGRLFKGCLYSVCILGTFLGGMALGEWQPVYYRMDAEHSRYSYFSQVMVGLPALPALVQKSRFERDSRLGPLQELDAALAEPFEGEFVLDTAEGRTRQAVSGELTLEPAGESGVDGRFSGTVLQADGTSEVITLTVRGGIEMQQRVYPSPDRGLRCGVVDENGDYGGELIGSVPRSFLDWCEVPLDNETLESVHGRLGKQFDLASVFTWIAGLLNVLAVWDAMEGPAYGYGDEQPEESDDDKEKDAKDTKAPAGTGGSDD